MAQATHWAVALTQGFFHASSNPAEDMEAEPVVPHVKEFGPMRSISCLAPGTKAKCASKALKMRCLRRVCRPLGVGRRCAADLIITMLHSFHRSHFGSRYTLGGCACAGLFSCQFEPRGRHGSRACRSACQRLRAHAKYFLFRPRHQG